MADERYVIDIILKARDDTAAAFASAIGNAEAAKRITEEQDRASKELRRSYADMTKELSTSQQALRKVMNDQAKGSKEAQQGMVDLEAATSKYVKTIKEHGRDSAQAALAARELDKTQKDLVTSFKEAGVADAKTTAESIVNATKRMEKAKEEHDFYLQAAKDRADSDRKAAADREEQMRRGDALANELEENAAIGIAGVWSASLMRPRPRGRVGPRDADARGRRPKPNESRGEREQSGIADAYSAAHR